MATIDDKVVAMSFESSKFESGVSKTISAIDKLKAALHFPGAGKGLDDINAAAKRVDLSHIGRGVEAVKGALSALRLVGIGVMANLASTAVRTGLSLVKSFTLGPAIAGFNEYSTNLNSIQTILANTQASGAGLKDVNAALDELNAYSDKTIYNFSQMAKNIGTFTAAGVDLDTSTQAIKGIANLAALSGSNADQASTAMYQLSQAISAGRVGLQDWNSVVNAGMGGTVFQRALATTAENMGTLKEGTLKLVGPMKNVEIAGESFRQSMQAGPGKTSWLTSKVLTETLKQFTGDLTNAELKAKGFNDAQIKAIQQTAATAQHAATEVKTISQVLDVAKETAGSGWAQTFRIIFGDFEEAKTTFTALSNTINGFINKNAEARNKVLGDWKALGGRTVLIEGIKNVFEALGKVIEPIKQAFRAFFPPKTGQDLYDLTVRFRDFTETLKPSETTLENLRLTFGGIFALLRIGKTIVFEILGVFGKLFGTMGEGRGGFLNFTASIGKSLIAFDKWLDGGYRLSGFFDGLADILAKPIELLGKMADALGNLFGGFDSGGISDKIGGATSALTPFQKVLGAVADAWDRLMDSVSGSNIFEKAIDGVVKAIQGISSAIANAASNMNFEAIFAVIRTGLFAGLVLMFKNFFGKGSFLDQVGKGFGGGIIKNITGAFGALEGTMKSLQTNIKADTLQKIAIAIGVLTASIVALSFVDPDRLKSSLAGIGVAMGMLLGAMLTLEKVSASKGFLKMPFITGAMILLAGAIDVLAVAVFALSKLSWEELLRGLSGVGALMAGLVVAVKPLSAASPGLIRAGIGLGAIAVAMNILALAVKQMSGLSWQEMAKGLAGVAGGLTALAAATNAMPSKGMIGMGLGVIALAAGMKIMASAMKDFAGMNMKDIGKGLLGVGGALVVIAGAMHLMPGNMALTAGGLLLVAFSLDKIASAVIKMGGMSLGEIARGLGTLAGSLAILAAGLYAMSGTLAGAAALTVAAAGISLLAGALLKMSAMSPREIITSLIALAAALTVVGVAGALLTPAVPSLLGLGAALLLIGGGLALAGAGIFLIGAGLSAIAVAGTAAVGVLVAALLELENGMVELAKNLILGLLEIVDAFAATAPKFFAAMIKIVEALLDAIIKLMPKVAEAVTAIITTMLKVLRDNQNKIIQAGIDLLLALLTGIKNNLPKIVTVVADIISEFLSSLAKNANKIITAGVELLVKLIEGIAKNIKNIASAAVDIITEFIAEIGKGYKDILDAGVEVLVNFINGLSKNISDLIDAGTDFIITLIQGIEDAGEDIIRAGTDAMIKFMNALVTESLKLVDAGATAIVNFLNGVANAIDAHADEMRGAGLRVAGAIISGLTGGLTARAHEVYDKISGIMGKALGLMHKIPLINSPSKVTTKIGEGLLEGMVDGMDNHAPTLYKSATAVSNNLIDTFKDVFKIRSPSKVMQDIGQAVGQGFAEGLKGSGKDIQDAFTDLNNKMADEMLRARENITSEQEKLAAAIDDVYEKNAKLQKLRAEKKPDKEAIADALKDLKESQAKIREIQAVLIENEDVLKRTTAGHIALTETLRDEKKELIKVAGEYEVATKKLEDARKKLDDIKKARDALVASTTAQYSVLPELSTLTPQEIAEGRKNLLDAKTKLEALLAETEKDEDAIATARSSVTDQEAKLAELLKGKILNAGGDSVNLLATYESDLKARTAAVGAYNKTLEQLRKYGIDEATYKKLVADGTADKEFAEQLVKGGEKAVTHLGTLDTKLVTVAKSIGKHMGAELYSGSLAAQQEIVKGFKKDQKTAFTEMKTLGHKIMSSLKNAIAEDKDGVGDEMESVGKEMIARMKKALGMKSPSKEMIEIGRFSIEGLAKGLTDNTHLVSNASDQVAKDALRAMQRSMQSIHGAVLDELDASPVIVPILDLSIVRGQSKELAGLIPASSSYGQAAIISASQNGAQSESSDVALAGTAVKFEQNNYSPTALSEIDIYRNTKNQLSQLKSALAIS